MEGEGIQILKYILQKCHLQIQQLLGNIFFVFLVRPCCLPLYTDGSLELAQFQAAQMDRCWPETYGVCEAPPFPRLTEPIGTFVRRCK